MNELGSQMADPDKVHLGVKFKTRPGAVPCLLALIDLAVCARG